MALYKIKDFYPNYRDSMFGGHDIKGFDVLAAADDKVGTVSDVLVDEEGRFRYFVLDTGFWIFGKKVLLPVGRSRIDQEQHRIYAPSLTKAQAESLPAYDDSITVDTAYEDQVRGIYRTTPLESSSPLEASRPVETARSAETARSLDIPGQVDAPAAAGTTYDYRYNQEPDLYNLNDRDHQTLRLYEERLIASKQRTKTGEVAVGKHVETETQRVAVPVERERIVVERTTPSDAGTVVSPGTAAFQEGEVARVEVYEEVPEIHKEAVLREEVRVKKVAEQETVEAQETLRREELDINTQHSSTQQSSTQQSTTRPKRSDRSI